MGLFFAQFLCGSLNNIFLEPLLIRRVAFGLKRFGLLDGFVNCLGVSFKLQLYIEFIPFAHAVTTFHFLF